MATSLPLVDLDIFLRDPLGAEGQAEALKVSSLSSPLLPLYDAT